MERMFFAKVNQPAVEHHDEPDAGFALLSRRRLSWALGRPVRSHEP
jgi:hypothetical protein